MSDRDKTVAAIYDCELFPAAANSLGLVKESAMSVKARIQSVDFGLRHTFGRKARVEIGSVATAHTSVDFVLIDLSLSNTLGIILKVRSVHMARTSCEECQHSQDQSYPPDFRLFDLVVTKHWTLLQKETFRNLRSTKYAMHGSVKH